MKLDGSGQYKQNYLVQLFSSLCEAMDPEYENLLLHADVRGLPRSKLLLRLFGLRNQVESFWNQAKSNLSGFFHKDKVEAERCSIGTFAGS